MATGIVSVAAFFLNMKGISWALFQLNKLSCAILIVLCIVRLFRFFTFFIRDIIDLEHGPPLLTALYVWRYARMRFPVAYDVQYWCMVFPLGMYACCTLQLGQATGLMAFTGLSIIFFYIALTVWVVTFFGLLRGVFKILFKRA